MCGIVAYTGFREARSILLESLKRLEYRGYDSAGIAIQNGGNLQLAKAAGRISVLEQQIANQAFPGTCGLSHTRWATHGAPNDRNAHPHTDASGRIALVHNGIIENYQSLRTYLEHRGIEFQSDTDTEVLVQLIGHFYKGDLEAAVRAALRDVRGTYGIAVVCADEPGRIIAARKGSPLIIGVGDDEYVVASDAAAIIQHTTQVIYLSDGELANVWEDGFRTTTLDAMPVTKEVTELEMTLEDIELGSHEHFMFK
ncbi:MAG: glutamine--fructose-6-phosphate aminotransferase, partial [Phycisphaerales bacterium]|nr:glutamine--fructose-6-phosphate aminotransferase [Phycisphaerales bacterium]